MNKSRPKSRVRSTIIKLALVVIIFFAFMLSLWLFEWPQFGDPETQVDAPAEIAFSVQFKEDQLGHLPFEEWPSLTLRLTPEDAAALGAPIETSFEWNPDQAQTGFAIVTTQNYWQDTQEQVIEWPCLQGPVHIASDEEQVIGLDPGYCPRGSTTRLHSIDPARVEPLLPAAPNS